jgi:hypothetical protein
MMLLGWIIATSLATGTFAQSENDEDPGAEIVSLSTDPASCNVGLARRIDLARLARDYANLRGECVAVQGWRKGRAIYQSYEAARLASVRRTGVQIGLYADNSTLASQPSEPRVVTAAGLVGACETLPPGSFGYCHFVLEGGFLIIGELRAQH